VENELLALKVRDSRGFRGYSAPENFEKFGTLRMHSLEQELGYLNRKGNTNCR